MTTTTTTARAYAACLACYNAGRLVGAWIDLDQTADEIGAEVAAMIAGTHPEMFCGTKHYRDPAWPDELPCEEHAWHDYDGLPSDLVRELGEWASFDTLATVGEALEDHGDAFAVYVGVCGDIDNAVETFADAYCGEHDGHDLRGYAEALAEDDDIPTRPWPFDSIDYDQAATELDCAGYSAIPAGPGTVHVFRPV